MSDTTLSADQLLPFEREDGKSEHELESSLFDSLASDPEFADETTEGADEPGSEEGVEPESDAPAEDEFEDDFDEEEFEDDLEAEESDEDELEDDEAEEEPESEPEPQTFRVKVDGEETEVTLDELKSGYSRHADYTRKTQELAQERATYREARDKYAETLDKLDEAIKELTPPEPDWDTLRKENPTEFAAQFAEHQRRQQQRQAIEAEKKRVLQEQQEDWQAEMQEHLEAERKKLHEAIPEWQDPESAAAEKKRLANYATQTYGWSEKDLESVVDHRLMLVLRKAMLYDEGEAKAEGTKEKIRQKAKKAKVLKPGGRNPRTKRRGKKAAAKRAMERLARTGDERDAQAAILGMLEDD